MLETIYVALLDEGTDVWAPVKADLQHDNLYRIVTSPDPECRPQFGPGVLVHCQCRQFGDGNQLVAFEAAP